MKLKNITRKKTLYERLGGRIAISAFADAILPRLMKDPMIGHYWAGRDAANLNHERELLIDFLCRSAGGSHAYTGKNMAAAHKDLNVSENDWEIFIKHLKATLGTFCIPKKERGEVLDFMKEIKADIVAAAAVMK